MKKTISLFVLILAFIAADAQTDTAASFSSFDNVKIHYEIKGTGMPVLLIHGFTGNGSGWKKSQLYDSLITNGFKVIIVDLRGNGLSDKPLTPEAYDDDAEAKDLIGLITHLGIEQYYALGYSRGSIILARLLVKDKRCRRAVIGGMGADFTDPLWPRRISFYNALMNDTIPGFDEFRKSIAARGLNPTILAYQQKGQPSTSKEALSKIRIPVLVICGSEDEDNGKGQELQQMIPASKFSTVPGNHNNTSGSPAFAQEAVTFFKQTKW